MRRRSLTSTSMEESREADTVGFGRWVFVFWVYKVEERGGGGGGGGWSGGGGGGWLRFAGLFKLVAVFDFELDFCGFSSQHFGIKRPLCNLKFFFGMVLISCCDGLA